MRTLLSGLIRRPMRRLVVLPVFIADCFGAHGS